MEILSFYGDLVRVSDNGKCGIFDKNGWREIVPCKYDAIIEPIVENRFPVSRIKLNGKYGLIDRAGNEICPCIYDLMSDVWHNGQTFVAADGKWGILNTQGQEVFPLTADGKLCCRQYGHWFEYIDSRKLMKYVFEYRYKCRRCGETTTEGHYSG
jgi:hypothetical protein